MMMLFPFHSCFIQYVPGILLYIQTTYCTVPYDTVLCMYDIIINIYPLTFYRTLLFL